MSNEKQLTKMAKSLERIDTKLGILIRLQRANVPKPTVGEEEKKILKLCDTKHTIEDIAKETEKTLKSVERGLSRLRKKVLIVSVKKDGKTVYRRI